MFNSLWPHGLNSLWNSPSQNTGVSTCSLLQGIFPTQGSNPGLPHCRWILYQLNIREAQEYWSRLLVGTSWATREARDWDRALIMLHLVFNKFISLLLYLLFRKFLQIFEEVVLDQKLGEVFQFLMMNVIDISLWEVASSHVTCDAGRADWRLHRIYWALRLQFNSVAQSCPRLCDPMNRSTPGLPVHHHSNTCPLSQWHHPTISSCCPLLLLPSIFPSIRVFSNESALCIRWPKYWSFSFSISTSNEHPGLISFRMDWLDLLAVQGTLKSLFQHHSSKHQFFGSQLSL